MQWKTSVSDVCLGVQCTENNLLFHRIVNAFILHFMPFSVIIINDKYMLWELNGTVLFVR